MVGDGGGDVVSLVITFRGPLDKKRDVLLATKHSRKTVL